MCLRRFISKTLKDGLYSLIDSEVYAFSFGFSLTIHLANRPEAKVCKE